MTPLLLALVAACGFLLAAVLADTSFGTSRGLQQRAMLGAAGILLAVALADLVPETFELLHSEQAAFAIAGGFLLLYLVETLTGGHTHHHEPHVGGHGHGHAHAHEHEHEHDGATKDPCVPIHAVAPFLVGLGIHNVADGVVVGASDAVSDRSALGVAVGILVHQLPVGLSFAAVLLAAGRTSRQVRAAAAGIAALIPAGALAVLALPRLEGADLGVLLGAGAGALLYIATGHLLPEAHSEHRHPGAVATFCVALLATILLVSMLESHG